MRGYWNIASIIFWSNIFLHKEENIWAKFNYNAGEETGSYAVIFAFAKYGEEDMINTDSMSYSGQIAQDTRDFGKTIKMRLTALTITS